MKRARPTLRVRLRETGSTLDIWLVPYKWPRGVCLSDISDTTFTTEGPERGVIETIAQLVLWLHVRRLRNGSVSKPLSAT